MISTSNLVRCDAGDPVRLGGAALELGADVTARLASFGGDAVVVGFRPEAVRVGEGPLKAHIRTVEDLGSEVVVHVAFAHAGDTVSLVSKMPAPFHGVTGDPTDVQVAGTVHVFDPAGARLTTAPARVAP